MKDIYLQNDIYFRFRKEVNEITEINTTMSAKVEELGLEGHNLEYIVVPCTYNGYGKFKTVSIDNGPSITDLSNIINVTLMWDRVDEADFYIIYGRENDYMGYLATVEQIPDQESLVQFIDDGSNNPDVYSPPPYTKEGTSGRQKWDSLLFVPGKNLQTAELNDIQLINNHYLKNLGDTIFEEGNVVEGCYTVVNEEKSEDGLNYYDVFPGKIYILGKVRNINGGYVKVPTIGESKLGLQAIEIIIDSDTDPALLDPAYGKQFHGAKGAIAKSYEFKWIIDDDNMVSVYKFTDGLLKSLINASKGDTNYGKLSKVLAKRTFEESGNYVAKPFNFATEENTNNDEYLYARSDAGGVAYLLGNRIEFFEKYQLPIRKGRDINHINGEVQSYNESSNIYDTNSYYVKKIDDMVCLLNKTESITKGLSMSRDQLSEKSPAKVVTITWDDGGTIRTYEEFIDFKLEKDFIDWSVNPQLSANPEPTVGETYIVNYNHSSTLTRGTRVYTEINNSTITPAVSGNDILPNTDIVGVSTISSEISGGGTVYIEGVDFNVIDDVTDLYIGTSSIEWISTKPVIDYFVNFSYWNHTIEGDYISADSYDRYDLLDAVRRDSIDFRTSSTNKPNNNTIFSYDYDYYLGRIDRIVLSDTSFSFDVKEGASSEDPNPPQKPSTGMSLCKVLIPPYTYSFKDVRVIEDATPTYTMEKISKLDKRISNLEYYVLLEQLEKESLSLELNFMKKGLFVDSFSNVDKIDFGYNTTDETKKVKISIDETGQTMQLPLDIVDVQHTFMTGDATQTKDSYILPFDNEKIIEQTMVTGSVPVNPNGTLDVKGQMNVLPTTDTWFDTSQKPELKVNFDGIKELFDNYDKLSNILSTKFDSWRTLDAGINSNEKESLELVTNVVGNKTGKYEALTNTDASTKLAVNSIKTTTEIRATVDHISTTNRLGNRVMDVSVIKTVRPIPVLFYVDGLVPGIIHNILFDGEICKVYPVIYQVGVEIPNPLIDDKSYTSYLQKFETLKVEVNADYSTDIDFISDGFGVIPNDIGKVAAILMVPADKFPTGIHKIEIKSASSSMFESGAVATFLTTGYMQSKQNVAVTMELPSLNVAKTTTQQLVPGNRTRIPAPPVSKRIVNNDFNSEINTTICSNYSGGNSVLSFVSQHIVPWYNRTRSDILKSKNASVFERWMFQFDLVDRPNRYFGMFVDPLNLDNTKNEVQDFIEITTDTCLGGINFPLETEDEKMGKWVSKLFIQTIRNGLCTSSVAEYDGLLSCWNKLHNIETVDFYGTIGSYKSACIKQRDVNLVPVATKQEYVDQIISPWYTANKLRIDSLGTFTNDQESRFFNTDLGIDVDAWQMLFPDPANPTKAHTLLSIEYVNNTSCITGITGTTWINKNYYEWVVDSLRLTVDEDYIRIFNGWLNILGATLETTFASTEDYTSACWLIDNASDINPIKSNPFCQGPKPTKQWKTTSFDRIRFNLNQKPFQINESTKVIIKSEEDFLREAEKFIHDLYSSYIITKVEVDSINYIGNPVNGFLGQHTKNWTTQWATIADNWTDIHPEVLSQLLLAWFPDPDNVNINKIFTGSRFTDQKMTSSTAVKQFILDNDKRILNNEYVNIRKAMFNDNAELKSHYPSQLIEFDKWYSSLLIAWNTNKKISIQSITDDINNPKLVEHDPLAQSFFLPELSDGRFISAVGVYINHIGDKPITISLREIKNGYPSDNIISKCTKYAGECNSSSNGSIETIFEFESLAWIKPGSEVCFTVYSSDTRYTLFNSRLGSNDINTGNVILKQADAGTMFIAPNQTTWEMKGYSDLSFNIYGAKFTSNKAEVIFNNDNSNDFSIHSFDTTIFNPVGTELKYFASYDNGINWKQVELNGNVENSDTKNQLMMKIELYGNSELSPVIFKHKISSKIIKFDLEGRYITRTIETAEDFDNARVILKRSEPVDTNFTPEYSLDNGISWLPMITFTRTYVDGKYWEYDFINSIPFNINNYKLRLSLTSTDNSKSVQVKDLRILLY